MILNEPYFALHIIWAIIKTKVKNLKIRFKR